MACPGAGHAPEALGRFAGAISELLKANRRVDIIARHSFASVRAAAEQALSTTFLEQGRTKKARSRSTPAWLVSCAAHGCENEAGRACPKQLFLINLPLTAHSCVFVFRAAALIVSAFGLPSFTTAAFITGRPRAAIAVGLLPFTHHHHCFSCLTPFVVTDTFRDGIYLALPLSWSTGANRYLSFGNVGNEAWRHE